MNVNRFPDRLAELEIFSRREMTQIGRARLMPRIGGRRYAIDVRVFKTMKGRNVH